MTAILNLICFVLIVLFVQAYDQILNLNQVNSEPEPDWRVSFVVEYIKPQNLALESTYMLEGK